MWDRDLPPTPMGCMPLTWPEEEPAEVCALRERVPSRWQATYSWPPLPRPPYCQRQNLPLSGHLTAQGCGLYSITCDGAETNVVGSAAGTCPAPTGLASLLLANECSGDRSRWPVPPHRGGS